MENPIYIDEWKWIHAWRIEVYRSKGEISPLKDIYRTRSFQDNEPFGKIEHSIEFKDAKNLIEEYGEAIVPKWETTFDEVEKFAIGYLLDSVKGEINDTMKNLSSDSI